MSIVAYKFQSQNGSYWYIKADDQRTINYWEGRTKLIPLRDDKARITADGAVVETHDNDAAPALSPAEALYGFAAWLTCRDASLTLGAAHNAAEMAQLVGEYVRSQGLEPPRDDYGKRLAPVPLEAAQRAALEIRPNAALAAPQGAAAPATPEDLAIYDADVKALAEAAWKDFLVSEKPSHMTRDIKRPAFIAGYLAAPRNAGHDRMRAAPRDAAPVVTDAMVAAYLSAQRQHIEEQDAKPFGVRDPKAACKAGLVAALAAPRDAAAPPAGFKLVAVKGFELLLDGLDRAARKGYMPDALTQEWDQFEWCDAAPPTTPQEPQ